MKDVPTRIVIAMVNASFYRKAKLFQLPRPIIAVLFFCRHIRLS